MKKIFFVAYILTWPAVAWILLLAACDGPMSFRATMDTDSLSVADVSKILVQAVEQSNRAGVATEIAITDREGNVMAVYRMTGARDMTVNALFSSIARARTAAFLSSNQHAFTTLTACYITRQHFPPGVQNTPGGPLYGVVFSQLGGGDIQRNGGAITGQIPNGQPGLTGVPGGFPLYKNGALVGGLGVAGGALDVPNTLNACNGASVDEGIALSSLTGFEPPAAITADKTTLDGISLAYTNATRANANYTLDVSALAVAGASDRRFTITTFLSRLPARGYSLAPRAGMFLSENDVTSIIQNAAARSLKTRTAIRKPASSPARVWISVVDVNGQVLGTWRDDDAAIFGMDVSTQKARTALAFSDTTNSFGQQIRAFLNLTAGAQLSVSTRALGWLAQDWFPPGIDIPAGAAPGPMFEGANFAWQQRLAALPGLPPYGNGITIFPGGIPLWRGNQIVGAIGVSGDGVDQDDYIAAAGASGYEAPLQWRTDFLSYSGARLPYLKFPRQPDLP